MLGETERELMIAATLLPRAFYEAFIPELLRLQSRSTSVKFLVAKDVVRDGLMKLNSLRKIRVKEQMFGIGIISDSRRVMLLVGTRRDSTYLAISSDHLGLVGLAKEYFDYLWEDAEPI